MEDANALRLDVWQFVRVMVALEAMPETAARRAWGEAWREIDDRLERLRETDAAAFATLMMDEEVVLPIPGVNVLGDAARALRRVEDELAAALSEPGLSEERRSALAFERRALGRRRKALQRRMQTETAPRRRTRATP